MNKELFVQKSDDGKSFIIKQIPGDVIADIWTTEQDAKLFAAAPEMLKILQNIVKIHRDKDSGEGELFGLDYITSCIEIIRKATN
jgi:hypothetical protein